VRLAHSGESAVDWESLWSRPICAAERLTEAAGGGNSDPASGDGKLRGAIGAIWRRSGN